jgi:hypothetical protein
MVERTNKDSEKKCTKIPSAGNIVPGENISTSPTYSNDKNGRKRNTPQNALPTRNTL